MNIKDIARIAEVGVSTVSRVINNHPDVKADTRQRVLEIIKENNYIPNTSAQILKQNNTNYIGVLVKGVFNPFFSEMVKVIGEAIEKSNYTMILQYEDTEESDMDSLVSFVQEKRLRGLVYLGGRFEDVPKERFEKLSCQVVLVCSNVGDNRHHHAFSSVGINDFQAAYDAMHYILGKGHTNVGVLIGECVDKGVGEARLKGYTYALRQEQANYHLIEGHYEYSVAYEKTLECLKEHSEITAIVASADTMAVGAARAVLDSGRQIGQDIAIMGFDGMEIATFYNPALTTIAQPRVEIAKKGIEILLGVLAESQEHEHLLFDTTLLERASS